MITFYNLVLHPIKELISAVSPSPIRRRDDVNESVDDSSCSQEESRSTNLTFDGNNKIIGSENVMNRVKRKQPDIHSSDWINNGLDDIYSNIFDQSDTGIFDVLKEFEDDYQLSNGDLVNLYIKLVGDFYIYRIISIQGNELKDAVNKYINHYLCYLLKEKHELILYTDDEEDEGYNLNDYNPHEEGDEEENEEEIITDNEHFEDKSISITSDSNSIINLTNIPLIEDNSSSLSPKNSIIDENILKDCIKFPFITYNGDMTLLSYSRLLDKDENECSTFLIDSKLHLIYSYTIEKALLQTLKKKSDMLLYGPTSFYQKMIVKALDYLIPIQEERVIYRVGSYQKYYEMSSYPYAEEDTELHPGTWVIYTKRSSKFFKTVQKHISNKDHPIRFSNEYCEIQSLSFQVVLFLCGNHLNFKKRHCIIENEISDHNSSSPYSIINIKPKDASDWIIVPLWYLSIYSAITKNNNTNSIS